MRNETETAKINMIKQQINSLGKTDQRIIDAMMAISREDFVPENYRALAYADMHIPLGEGAHMLKPRQEGEILQHVNLKQTDRVLLIGTGSGYLTALVAKIAYRVTSVDIRQHFSQRAKHKLKSYGLYNVKLQTGNAANGWNDNQMYDVIIITGALYEIPEAYKNKLNVGGRLLGIVGDDIIMHAIIIERETRENFKSYSVFDTRVNYLQEAKQPEEFVF